MNITGYDFRRPEAQQLADLSIVESDLQRVLEQLAPIRLGETFQNLSAAYQELHWSASLVRYARVFPPGVLRWDWKNAISTLDEKDRETHYYVMDVRNGFIAHSIGNMEESVPVVQIAVNDDGGMLIQSVHCNGGRIVCGSSTDIERFHQLASAMLVWVNTAIKEECRKLLELAESIGANELVKAGMWTSNVSGHKPRSARRLFLKN